ncbi:restriction endonuclease subunit S [Vibrio splendidus]
MSNLVPEGWSLRNLGSTLDVLIAGQSPNRKEFPARPSEYGILKTTAIDWGRFYPQHNQEVLDDFKPNLKHEVAVDDILITKAGPVHRVGVVAHVKSTPSKILVSGKMTLMRVKQDYVSSFIAYALSTEYSQKPLKESTTGMASSQTNFTHDTLKEIPIVVPDSKNEQKKIAAILTSVDDVIEKTQAQIDKLKDLKTGMMQELLTRGVGVDGMPHTEFKGSPVGRIPKGWDVVALSQSLSKIDSGWSPACVETPPATGEWGVIKVSAVTRGRFLEQESKTLPNNLEPKPHTQIKRGDILLTRANGVADLVGKCVMVHETPKANLMMSDKILRLNYNDRIHSTYLLHYFNSRQVRKQIELSWGGSSGQKNISQADIKGYFIALPPLNEQIVIGDSISKIDTLLSVKEAKLRKLEDSKKALMQDLLTGKVRVKVDS